MTRCARGCCWSPFGCARNRACDCHAPTLTEWLGVKAANEPAGDPTHRDPTARTAIRNIERQRKKGAGR